MKMNSKSVFPIGLFLLNATLTFGQIRYDESRLQWRLDSDQMTYVIGVNQQKMVQSLYWGPRLSFGSEIPKAKMGAESSSFDPSMSTTQLEYPAWGAGLSTEPALKVTSSNGDRTLVLEYSSANLNGDLLELTLRDRVQPIAVRLFYRVFEDQGIIARWSKIENLGDKPIVVEQVASATWNLPPGSGYEWSWLTGRWAAEWQLHTASIQTGAMVIESRRGSTSHQANPWFSVGRSGETTEEDGPVWFGELGWSGSWRMVVESTPFDQVRITAGYNPFDFAYKLSPGESLETPLFYAGFTQHGNGGASRLLHRFQLQSILPQHPSPKPRPIIYNSWEATGFAVDEANQLALAEKAAKLGVERFVIDDGWFGERNSDHAGLGDWQTNPGKFPHGLKPIIDRVHDLGMDFGLWVEPEMVNPDSDLYRKHPDWVMSFPGRQRTEGRNQLVLNLAREDVKDFIFSFLDRLVSQNDIAFLKWDYNRNWSEPGWDAAPPDEQKRIYVKYVENLYDILDRLRKRHPRLEIESCSGGGGRVDLGILRYTDEIWPSDNTDALDRLQIQDGFTHAYAPMTMVAWVTDVPDSRDSGRVPLQFRFLTAMQGALGIGGNLNHWTSSELQEGARLVAFYRQIRTTIQTGQLYRLIRPGEKGPTSVQYVGADGRQTVLFVYLRSKQFGGLYSPVRLRGLDPEAQYRVRCLNDGKYIGESTVSGALLMTRGISLLLHDDYDSTAVVLEREITPASGEK